VIRPARPGDEPGVRRVVAAAYAVYISRLGRPPGSMLADYGAPISDGRVWVAEAGRDHEVIGILILSDQPDALHVDNVAVHPHAQRGGVGRALLAFAREEAARRGYHVLRLSTNALFTESIAVYHRLGFKETGRVLAPNGSLRIHFERRQF
jgi:ribosomal protein S18 acetylase RimI-like enzyme